jgi:hypothetical protein
MKDENEEKVFFSGEAKVNRKKTKKFEKLLNRVVKANKGKVEISKDEQYY